SGNVFISVRDSDKPTIVPIAKELKQLGFNVFATSGTARFLQETALDCQQINKISQGRPHILDKVQDHDIVWIVNTSLGKRTTEDSYQIRRAAIDLHIPYTTTATGAAAVIKAMKEIKEQTVRVKPVQKFA
ncbi:MAG: carbamoyl phosphate synthase large subunit, partial [Desulfobacterales bacterium]|nr:carbamoyl phosphate synthase large subunit [Desulfobacterales bacterium]